MADGYMIEIVHPLVAEGRPLRQVWYAHIQDPKQAVEAVRKAARVARGSDVDIVRPERRKVLLERFALLEGEVRPK